MIAVHPRIDALLQRKIHPRRTHLHVQKKTLGISQRFQEGHYVSLVATPSRCSSLFCIDLSCLPRRYSNFNAIVVQGARQLGLDAPPKPFRRYDYGRRPETEDPGTQLEFAPDM